jgi:hypothetical protein
MVKAKAKAAKAKPLKLMTKAQHRARHKLLHKYLDELLADFIAHKKGPVLRCTLGEFVEWSAEQVRDPKAPGPMIWSDDLAEPM